MKQIHPYAPAMIFVVIATAAVISGCGPSKTTSPGSAQPIATFTVATPERSMVQDTLDYRRPKQMCLQSEGKFAYTAF